MAQGRFSDTQGWEMWLAQAGAQNYYNNSSQTLLTLKNRICGVFDFYYLRNNQHFDLEGLLKAVQKEYSMTWPLLIELISRDNQGLALRIQEKVETKYGLPLGSLLQLQKVQSSMTQPLQELKTSVSPLQHSQAIGFTRDYKLALCRTVSWDVVFADSTGRFWANLIVAKPYDVSPGNVFELFSRMGLKMNDFLTALRCAHVGYYEKCVEWCNNVMGQEVEIITEQTTPVAQDLVSNYNLVLCQTIPWDQIFIDNNRRFWGNLTVAKPGDLRAGSVFNYLARAGLSLDSFLNALKQANVAAYQTVVSYIGASKLAVHFGVAPPAVKTESPPMVKIRAPSPDLESYLSPSITGSPQKDILITRYLNLISAEFAADRCFGPFVTGKVFIDWLKEIKYAPAMLMAWIIKADKVNDGFLNAEHQFLQRNWKEAMKEAASFMNVYNSITRQLTWAFNLPATEDNFAQLLSKTNISPKVVEDILREAGASQDELLLFQLIASENKLIDMAPFIEDACDKRAAVKTLMLQWLREHNAPVMLFDEFVKEAVEADSFTSRASAQPARYNAPTPTPAQDLTAFLVGFADEEDAGTAAAIAKMLEAEEVTLKIFLNSQVEDIVVELKLNAGQKLLLRTLHRRAINAH